jgi:hypothetical protein
MRKLKINCTNLSDGPMLLDERTAAKLLGVSQSYLRKARMTGQLGGRTKSPEFVHVGRKRIYYRREDLISWLEALAKRTV